MYQLTIFVTLTTSHINQQPPSTNISTLCDIYNSSYQPTTCVALTILQKSLTTTSQVCLSTNLCPFYTGRYRVFSFLTGFPDFQWRSEKRVGANQRYIFNKFSMKKDIVGRARFFFILWSILHLNFKTNPQNDEVRRKMETAAFLGEIWMRAVPVHFEERRTSHEHLEEEKGICRDRFTRRKEEKGAGRDLLGRKVWQMRVE